MSQLTTSPAWLALTAHRQEMADVQMRDLFAQDPGRFDRFSRKFNEILFDYSKNRITDKTMTLLTALAQQAKVDEWIAAMWWVSWERPVRPPGTTSITKSDLDPSQDATRPHLLA